MYWFCEYKNATRMWMSIFWLLMSFFVYVFSFTFFHFKCHKSDGKNIIKPYWDLYSRIAKITHSHHEQSNQRSNIQTRAWLNSDWLPYSMETPHGKFDIPVWANDFPIVCICCRVGLGARNRIEALLAVAVATPGPLTFWRPSPHGRCPSLPVVEVTCATSTSSDWARSLLLFICRDS